MKYIKLISTFNLPNGNPSNLCTYQKCADADFATTVNECVIVNRVTAKRMCGDVEPAMNHTTTELTLSEYNLAVVRSEEFTEDISVLSEELDSKE